MSFCPPKCGSAFCFRAKGRHLEEFDVATMQGCVQ